MGIREQQHNVLNSVKKKNQIVLKCRVLFFWANRSLYCCFFAPFLCSTFLVCFILIPCVNVCSGVVSGTITLFQHGGGGMTVSSPWVCLLAPGAGNTILNGRQLKSPRQERRGHFTPHLFSSKRSGKLSQLASTGIKIQIYATSNHLALSPCKPFASANWKGGGWEIRMTSFQDWKEGKTDIVKPTANLVGRNCDRLDHADDTKLIILANSATVQHQQKGDKSKEMNK